MFTLICLGVGVAYVYSLIATLLPGIFPVSFRSQTGQVAVYFEAAAVIVTLVLLGQLMELRARSSTNAAIRAARPRAQDGTPGQRGWQRGRRAPGAGADR